MSTARSSERPLGATLAALLLALLAAATALGAEDLERRMLEVAAGLRCPVCQNLSVADSTSDMARDMRALILEELRAGKQPDEIRAYFVSKYGQWILLSPSPRGVGLVLWVLPAAAALAGIGAAARALRRWARGGRASAPPAVDEARRARLRALVAGEPPLETLTSEEARAVEGLRELDFDYRAGKLSTGDYEELRDLYEARASVALAPPDPRPRRRAEVSDEAAARTTPAPRRARRLAAASLLLLGFGVAVGVLLSGAVRPRGEGSPTGDPMTGTTSADARADASDVPGLVERGRQAIEREDLKTAMTLLTRALEVDPEQPHAHAYLGLILLRAGHAERALQAFDRALGKDPVLAPALWGKGLVLYEALRRPAEAVHVWQTLLALKLSDEDRTHIESLVAEARARAAKPAALGR